MLTLDQIQKLEISPVIAKEAHEKTSQLLTDVLDTKANFEQKAYAFFSGYTTVAIALFSAGGALSKDAAAVASALWATGFIFVIGAAMFVLALRVKDYGTQGTAPSVWLTAEVLTGGERALTYVLAYQTFFLSKRIETSIRSNEEKAQWVSLGVRFGLLAPIMFFVAFMCKTHS